jgi:hypothetical protein
MQRTQQQQVSQAAASQQCLLRVRGHMKRASYQHIPYHLVTALRLSVVHVHAQLANTTC